MTDHKEKLDVKAVLFFSVDIVDSVAYKSNFVNEWSKDFEAFYETFPNILSTNCQSVKLPHRNAVDLPCPNTWKVVGDEMLFFIDMCATYGAIQDKGKLARYELALYYAIAFTKTIKKYNSEADEKLRNNDHAFKIKGTAWFANVVKGPQYEHKYGNMEIEVENIKGDRTKRLDFIGRQIDIGFRIAKYSTLNRFVISVEYAILLLRDNYLTIEAQEMCLYYEGRRPIKGILEYLDYPIIYIDMQDKLEHYENILLSKHVRPANLITLMQFMDEYIYRTNLILYYPFVHEDDRLFHVRLFKQRNQQDEEG